MVISFELKVIVYQSLPNLHHCCIAWWTTTLW